MSGRYGQIALDAEPPKMDPNRVKETGRQFGQKIGGREAKNISRLLQGRSRPAEKKDDKKLATDPPVSEKQRRAMFAAKNGKSTLGIPKKVGEEFVGKDKKKGKK